MVRRGPVTALFLLWLPLGSQSLSAWEYAGYWWWDSIIAMKTGALGQGQLEGTSYQALADAAMSNWYSYCSPEPSVTWIPSTDDCSPETKDDINCTGWANLGQCESGTVTHDVTYGHTSWWPNGSRLLEADVSMNSSCSEAGYWTPTRFLSSITHELGHVLGLHHSLAMPSLMNPDRDRNQTWHPEADDCAGVQWIYSQPAPPTATTYAASHVGQTSATLNAAVNPNGSDTTGWFNISGPSGGMTLGALAVGAGTSSVLLSYQTGSTSFGMSCNTIYRFHIAAQSIAGTVFGEDRFFTTSPCSPPSVSSTPATSIERASATLNGSVNAKGADTSAYFQWGPTTAYGYSTTGQAIGSSHENVALSLGIDNLACGTSYHFRVAAVSSAGSSFGSDRLLTTGSCVGTNGGFYTLVPCRAFDSRSDAPLQSGMAATIPLAGASPCPIPASAVAVAVNVTVVSPSNPGHLVLWPAGQPVPPTSTINFSRGKVRANNAIVSVGTDGQAGVVANLGGGGSVHCILDVTGYFEENAPE